MAKSAVLKRMDALRLHVASGNATTRRRLPLSVFCRRRLRVRTTKPLELLTPTQRAAIRRDGVPMVPLELTALQRKFNAVVRAGRIRQRKQGLPLRIILLKARRGGFSTDVQAMFYQRCDEHPRSQMVTLAHTADATRKIFGIVRTFRDEDPELPELSNPDSKTELEFVKNKSRFFIGTAGSQGFSRGDAVQGAHGSEVAYWKRGTIKSVLAGIHGAAESGDVILESTANGMNEFAVIYQEAKKGLNNYIPVFFPWFADPLNRIPSGMFLEEEIRDTLSDEEKVLITNHNLDLGQIAFRRARKKEYGDLFPQEFPETDTEAFLVSGQCYFSLSDISHCLASVRKPLRVVDFGRSGKLFIFKEPEKGKRYVAGSDTSEGLPDGDENGTAIIDFETGEDVALLYGLFSIPDQASLGADLCKKYDAFWGIERNNTSGGAVIQRVKALGYRKLYKFQPDREGFFTNAQTRPLMLDRLREFISVAGPGNIHSEIFLSQCAGFKYQEDGIPRGDVGSKDDCVMLRAIANEMRFRRPSAPAIYS